jgi:hypothetical protein
MANKIAGQPDPIFLDNVNELAKTSGALGDAAKDAGKRVWQLPPKKDWGGKHSDLAGLVSPFDRADVNNKYAEAIGNPESGVPLSDLMSLGLQISYVAAMERAYRARHASPVRCLLVAAARRTGHGKDAGVLKGGVVGYIQAVAGSGQSV